MLYTPKWLEMFFSVFMSLAHIASDLCSLLLHMEGVISKDLCYSTLIICGFTCLIHLISSGRVGVLLSQVH